MEKKLYILVATAAVAAYSANFVSTLDVLAVVLLMEIAMDY